MDRPLNLIKTEHATTMRPSRPLVVAVFVFVIAAAFASLLIWQMEQRRLQVVHARVSDLAGDHAHALQRNIERALSATYALAALVRQGNGTLSDFDAVARQMLPFYPGAALGLAPGGVVKSIVPLAGNEGAIGHDMLNDPARSKESVIAKESGELTLAGPFNLVQGGLGAVGRLPVFLDNGEGDHSFWGFTTVLLRFPETLDPARLSQLVERGFLYELWRINPDTGQKQVIAASSHAPLLDPAERTLDLPNGTWTLSVAPVKGWGDPLGLSIKIALGLLFSLMLSYIAKLLFDLKSHQQGLEALVARRTREVQVREADLNRAQSVARVGSWVLDPSSDKMRLSEEACRIFGESGDLSFSFEALCVKVHPDDRSAVNMAWQAALRGESHDIEYRIMSGETIRWVRGQTEMAIDMVGTLLSGIGTVQDITERKQAENEIRQKNAELERFTYTVSHDLKSPLITINSFSDSIKRDLASGRHDRLEKDLGRIGAAANKMAELLDGLLDLSRAGRIINTPVPVDMNELVEEVATQLAGPLRSNHMEIVVHPALPVVECDRQRMREVVQNLLENAIKYMGDQPNPEIIVGVRQEKGKNIFFVQDNGIGIAPKYHHNIFGLFNKLDVGKEGTGIGLALVKRIVEVHGGDVWVESEGAGRGSTFCFTLTQ